MTPVLFNHSEALKTSFVQYQAVIPKLGAPTGLWMATILARGCSALINTNGDYSSLDIPILISTTVNRKQK